MIRALAAPDLRLAAPALVLWIGCAVAVGMADVRPVALAAAGAVVVAVAVSARAAGRQRMTAVAATTAVAAAVLALGAVTVAVRSPERRPAPMTAAATASAAVELVLRTEGDVVEDRVEARVQALRRGDRAWSVGVPVTVFSGVPPGTPIGTRLRVAATLRATARGETSAYLAFARRPGEVVGRPPPALEALGGARAAFGRVASALPGDGGALLPGLAIGDTSRLGEQLRVDMRTASLAHLTAVSGANTAVVVGLVVVVLGAVGVPRVARVVVAVAVLGLFVVLVTPQPSVVRAAAMACLVLVATALGRPVRGLPVLALAVIVLLIGDPWLARDYGFVLSVLATGGLLLIAPMLARRLQRVLPRALALAIAVPLAAQLATQPVLLTLNPTMPLWAVPANLLAEPAAPVATVLGLVALILLRISPPLGEAVAALAWVPSAWIAAVARVAARLPGAALPWPPGAVGVAIVVVLTAAVLLAVVSAPTRVRLAAGALAGLILIASGGALVGSRVAADAGRPSDWQYAECDVGQGDATVVRSSGAVAVIDTGPDPALMRACLERLGIDRVDLLVLTHNDLDHVGGTPAVLGRVSRALVGPSSGADDDRLAALLRAGGARVEQAAAGLADRLGQLDWRVVWPPPRGVEPGNPASVTVSITPARGCAGGCLSGLLLGDLGAEPQQRMTGAARPGGYDLVKVAHHGSADQWPELYQRIRAAVALIGVGVGNRYGHPTPLALGMLADAGTRVYRTDRDGLVLIADRGQGRVLAWTQRRAAPAAADVPPVLTADAYALAGPRPRAPDPSELRSERTPIRANPDPSGHPPWRSFRPRAARTARSPPRPASAPGSRRLPWGRASPSASPRCSSGSGWSFRDSADDPVRRSASDPPDSLAFGEGTVG